MVKLKEKHVKGIMFVNQGGSWQHVQQSKSAELGLTNLFAEWMKHEQHLIQALEKTKKI